MASKKKPEATQAPAPAQGGKFKRTRAVTLPVLKVEVERTVYVKVTGPMELGKVNTNKKDEDGKPQKPATIMPIVNVETGEAALIIVGTALGGQLNDTYPGNGYVGKAFEITKHAKPAGKRYHTYSLYEIEA